MHLKPITAIAFTLLVICACSSPEKKIDRLASKGNYDKLFQMYKDCAIQSSSSCGALVVSKIIEINDENLLERMESLLWSTYDSTRSLFRQKVFSVYVDNDIVLKDTSMLFSAYYSSLTRATARNSYLKVLIERGDRTEWLVFLFKHFMAQYENERYEVSKQILEKYFQDSIEKPSQHTEIINNVTILNDMAKLIAQAERHVRGLPATISKTEAEINQMQRLLNEILIITGVVYLPEIADRQYEVSLGGRNITAVLGTMFSEFNAPGHFSMTVRAAGKTTVQTTRGGAMDVPFYLEVSNFEVEAYRNKYREGQIAIEKARKKIEEANLIVGRAKERFAETLFDNNVKIIAHIKESDLFTTEDKNSLIHSLSRFGHERQF